MTFRFITIFLATMVLVLAALAWAVFNTRPNLTGPCEPPYTMKFIMDLDTADMSKIMEELEGKPINVVTTTLAWSTVQPEQEIMSFDPYREAFKKITDEGICLNVILDTSGRLKLDENRVPIMHNLAYPSWLAKIVEKPYSIDFSGEPNSTMLNISQTALEPYVDAFYDASLTFLAEEFRDNIRFVSTGVTAELEVKFSQSGYRYLDYSPETEERFDRYLQALNLPEADLPKIDYASFFTGGAPRHHEYRDVFSRFRKDVLLNYYCARTEKIREHGFKAFGYFGGPFQPHDMIYASGVIEGAAKCFDAVAIDHNFYDGHKVDSRPEYVGMIVNYATNLGFDEVIVGLYVERLILAGTSGAEIERILNNALDHIDYNPVISGIEIGGFELTDKIASTVLSQKLLEKVASLSSPKLNKTYEIAVLGSFTSFELWQGEYHFGRSIHQDALQGTFEWLSSQPEISVRMVSEDDLMEHAFSVDAVYLPHVTAPTNETITNIQRLISIGVPVIQDVRFGEFETDGEPRENYPLSAFGIAASAWRGDDPSYQIEGVQTMLRNPKDFYASGMEMVGQPNFITKISRENGSGLILTGKNSMVIGYVPPFQEKVWQDAAMSSVLALIKE